MPSLPPRGTPEANPPRRSRRADLLDHELRDPVAAPHGERLAGSRLTRLTRISPAVARVDGAGGVDDGDPVPRGEPGAGVHERRVPGRQGHGEAGRDQGPLARRRGSRRRRGVRSAPASPRMGVGRQRQRPGRADGLARGRGRAVGPRWIGPAGRAGLRGRVAGVGQAAHSRQTIMPLTSPWPAGCGGARGSTWSR